MGRGAKIFLLSALIAGCIFGLIAFAVISAVAASNPKADPAAFSAGAVYKDHGLVSGESFNLLVVNVDYRPERYSYSTADVRDHFEGTVYTTEFKASGDYRETELLSALLLRVDRERNELTFTPIPAETEVTGSDGGRTTLAREYSLLGASALTERVRLLTGISIDRYAVVIPSALDKIVEKLGGLDVYVPELAESDGETSVPVGNRHISGDEARTLLLSGYTSSSREEVAMRMLQAAVAELTRLERGEIASLLGLVDTDLKVGELSFIGSRYHSFKKTELTLVGQYSGKSFLPDISATLDKFSVYRKYYG
jgi:anionic cell wall polymer biosynthesis LytR-Cps2A-Psr (LCP) family protein